MRDLLERPEMEAKVPFVLFLLREELLAFARKATLVNKKEDFPCGKVAGIFFIENYKTYTLSVNEEDVEALKPFLDLLTAERGGTEVSEGTSDEVRDGVKRIRIVKNTHSRSLIDKLTKMTISTHNLEEVFSLVKAINYNWNLKDCIDFKIKFFRQIDSFEKNISFLKRLEVFLDNLSSSFKDHSYKPEERIILDRLDLVEDQKTVDFLKFEKSENYLVGRLRHESYPIYSIVVYSDSVDLKIEDPIEDLKSFKLLWKFVQTVVSNFSPTDILKIKFQKLYVEGGKLKISSARSSSQVFSLLKGKPNTKVVFKIEQSHPNSEDPH